ncbi:metallophosphoesterase [Loktanella salsilacus]|jgi:3',5'-cyclic AMP phosphodiesterase CpdA|uniref:metallophosphoesterase family protein n=1 Tax=Loktanella salsilacus TaxID=195913 RepID=UPI0020B75985|nr:metallophosphoesterase [Loktanella salsilacus]UTH47782.1 metallophosphoesterase [Loktanella salsilacus]
MRLALLTDLHFGRAQPDLVPPLLDSITAASPDLIVIAGDFVQRARASQFRDARAFVDRLQHPWIAVPGNHDIPLFNVIARALAPRAAYRRWIAPDPEPMIETADAVIVGLDTTHRWSHQRGLIRQGQIDRVGKVIRTAQDKPVIIMAHHPFHHRPEVEKKVMKGAADALTYWAACGPHVILSGHLHTWTVEPFVAQKSDAMTLQIHCGTGLSTRLRGEANEYAIIDLDGDQITAQRMTATADTLRFVPESRHSYRQTTTGWHELL